MARLFVAYILPILPILAVRVFVRGEYESQPQLRTRDGSLILEAARDQNITLRTRGDAAALLIDDVNILDWIKKRLAPHQRVGDEDEDVVETPTPETVVSQIKSLKRELLRMTARLSNAGSHTRSTTQTRRIRRLLGRVRRVVDRLTLIEDQLSVNECETEPCRNGGLCFDLYKDFYCECQEGWTGKKCDEDVNECYLLAGTDLGCQNNALCINTPGSYRCNCTNGFSGTHCRLRSAACGSAPSQELCGHGACVPANNALGFACICDQGWTKDNLTTACTVDVDECEESRNPCHRTCVNLPGGFRCGPCPHGYTGNGVTCLDVDECARDNGGCSQKPRVQCINTEGSYHCGSCPPGWTGDGHRCEKAQNNSCDSKGICHPRATCEYISDTAVCTCLPGWYGHGFGPSGCSAEATSSHPCENHACKNNGTCVTLGRGTHCVCPLGFTGPLCETNDACNSNPCRNGGTCNLLPNNAYRCSCVRGTTGTDCEVLRTTCGAIVVQESGALTYPPDGSGYEPNERCAWIIRTSASKVLNVTFSHFDLEESADCSKDFLQVHDGRSLAAQLIGRFCGKALPLGGNIVSSHHQLFFWFRSDNVSSGGSLAMFWTSEEHTCGGLLELKHADSGVIRSPGYPGKAPANRECEWSLQSPYGTRLVFRFYEVALGGVDDNCTRDTLKVYDSDQLLEAICSTKLPEPKHTSSNVARLHFHTDSYREDSSFQLHYEVVAGDPNCGGLYTEPSGAFRPSRGSAVCLYLIQQPPGTNIRLDYLPSEGLREVEGNCRILTFEIFDGKTDEDPLIKRVCEGRKDESFVSSGNFMLVRYEFRLLPSNLGNRYTFEAKYSRVCGNNFFGPDPGVFTTPNYPNPYFDHMTCIFNIYGPINTVVHANFTDFSISETTAYMPEDTDAANGTALDLDVDDFANYVDVYLDNNQKRRYYKGDAMHLVSSRNRMRIVFHSNLHQRKARGFRVEYSFDTVSCGGVLIESEGSFRGLGPTYGSPPFCEWILEAPEDKQIRLDLSYSRFGAKCMRSEADVIIYMNSSVRGDQLVDSLCGEDKRISTTYASNLLTIILKRPPVERRGYTSFGLTANYTFVDDQIECGGNFSYRFGVIKSPGWPKVYPPSVDCIWRISAPLGHKIEIVAHNFSLEPEFSTECQQDYLEIRNGHNRDSPLIGKYCGTHIPARIPSFTNQLYLRFRSDRFLSFDGFYLTWEQTATGCGGKLNSHSGSIHSPHYPEISAGPVVCHWKIIVAQGSRINIRLIANRATDDLCENKTLTFYDGPTINSRVLTFNCSTPLISLQSSSNQVAVRYELQDGAREGQQFQLQYETDCVTQTDQLRGVIESPNFPDMYPPHTHCVWDIRGGRNNKISLAFSHLKLEWTPADCNYDYMEVVDMRDEEVLKTHRICTVPVDVLQTQGNRLVLKFKSDYSEGNQGFRAEFKRIGCGEHLQSERGSIVSPNAPYSVDVECDWYIELPAGRQIVLTIDELHIESEEKECKSDVMTVSNEPKTTNHLLNECHVSQPVTVTSMANRMYIHFHTSAKRERKYFRANYTSQISSCGGIFHGKRGTITSPNYPKTYAPSSTCVWFISVDETYGVSVLIDHLDLPNSTDCQDTFVEVKRANNTLESQVNRFCGSLPPAPVATYNNQLDIIFQAGTMTPQTGFSLRYEAICGGRRRDASGLIKSHMGETCIWFIEGAEGSHISVDILHLECPGAFGIDGLFLTEATSSSLFEHGQSFCEEHPANIMYSGNNVIIRASNVNFRAKYMSVQTSCGGSLTSLQGILASPYYPSTYPSNIECIWEIKAAKGNYIELDFDFISIANSEFCNEDFLEIRSAEGGSLLGLYCSNETPTEKLVAFETLWIKFRSTEDSTGEGFKLRWNYAHLNSINGTQGIIESPPTYSVRQQAEPFIWRIMAPRDYLIWVNFKEFHKGLYLYDGFDTIALKIDIHHSPWEFTSSSNVVLLKTENTEFDVFKLEWKTISEEAVEANKTISTCHEEILLPYNARVNLSSPGYPKGYDRGLACDWVVKVMDPITHAVLYLHEVDLEDMYDCIADSLTVSTSSDLRSWQEQLKVCHVQTNVLNPIAVIHGTPNLKLDLRTDSSLSGRGFTSLLTTSCGSNMTGPVGSILHPHLFRTQISNSACVWNIEVRAGRRIEFTFSYDEHPVKPNAACQSYAIIYDGIDDHAAMLGPGQICNRPDRNVARVLSTSSHAFVRYNVSRSVREGLWNLTYREFSECGGDVWLTHDAPSTNISTPHYPNVPHPFTECITRVMAPAGEAIQVDFIERFDMSLRYCNLEYVEFFDGSTPMARSLGRYCTKPGTLRTTGNALYIHYQADVSEPRSGFRIKVSLSRCGGTFADVSGEISSQGYPVPGAYTPQTTCSYLIKLPMFSRIQVNFSDVDLPFDKSEPEKSDHLEVFLVDANNEGESDSKTPFAVIYGNATQMPFLELDSNVVLLRFKTYTYNHKHRGFKLTYERTFGMCYKDVSGESGILTISKILQHSFYVTCRWKITVPKGQRVRLEFLSLPQQQQPAENTTQSSPYWFAMVRNSSRNFPVFTVYNNHLMQSVITKFDLSTYNASEVIQSTDNVMLIRIQFGHSMSTVPRTIRASYSSDDESVCPDDIGDLNSGRISLERLIVDTKNFYCQIRFTLSPAETMVFKVSELRTVLASAYYHPYAVRFQDDLLQQPFKTLNNNVSDHLIVMSTPRGSVSFLQTDVLRILKFEATFRRHPCGGRLPLEDGLVVDTPIVETVNYGSLDCMWQLSSDTVEGEYRLLSNVSLAGSCEEEYITLFTSSTPGVAPLSRICRDSGPLDVAVLESRFLTIVYHVDDYKAPQSRFSFSVEKTVRCGKTELVSSISGKSVVVDWETYRNNMECTWEFKTYEGFYLTLSFPGRFFVEESTNCTKDSVEVQHLDARSGFWLVDDRICGREVTASRNYTGRQLRVIFRTDANSTADGFTLRVVPTCELFFNVTNVTQTIASPEFMSLRIHKLHCVYTLLSDSDQYINVRIIDPLRMPAPQSCTFYSVTAYKREEEGLLEAGKYCDSAQLRSRHYLQLVVDALMEKHVRIEFELESCGGSVNKQTTIQPLLGEDDEKYAHGMNCIWNVTAPPDHSIVVRFAYLEMEASENCRYDYLAVYEGAVMSDEKRVTLLCGKLTERAPVVVVDSHQAVIAAVSDYSISHRGFQADVFFTRNCNERITLTDGNSPLTLVRHLAVNASEMLLCQYRVMAPVGYRVRVAIKDLQLGCTNATCEQCNQLEIFDSVQAQRVSLGAYCVGGRSGSVGLLSSFEDLLIKVSGTKRGEFSYEILLQMVESECGGRNELQLNEGTISLRFPPHGTTTYPPNVKCMWFISSSSAFQIDFDALVLQNVSQVTGKCMDYVYVKATDVSQYLCGNATGFRLVVRDYHTPTAAITFYSDAEIEATGFQLTAKHLGACNRTYTATSGLISYRRSGSNQESCFDEIRVPENYTLNFYDYGMTFYTPYSDCNTYSFKLIDLVANKTLRNVCRFLYDEKHLITSTNAVRIEFATPSLHLFYMSTKKPAPPGCGGEMFTQEGSLQSPSYAEDRNQSECRWDIIMPASTKIRVVINEFNMGSEVNCPLDYVKFIEVRPDGGEEVAATYCGPSAPQQYVSRNSHIAIFSKKSSNFDGTGWWMSFQDVEKRKDVYDFD